MVSDSERPQGTESGVPARAPVYQIRDNCAGLVTSADVSRASVVLAGSDLSTTRHDITGPASAGRRAGDRVAFRPMETALPGRTPWRSPLGSAWLLPAIALVVDV